MADNVIMRFFGGSPLMVLFRLILLSILAGVILSALGVDPWNIMPSIKRFLLGDLGHGLRRGALGLALFPARGRHRRARSG